MSIMNYSTMHKVKLTNKQLLYLRLTVLRNLVDFASYILNFNTKEERKTERE